RAPTSAVANLLIELMDRFRFPGPRPPPPRSVMDRIHDAPDTPAITRSSGRKETTASGFFITAVALGRVRVFPIRNGLCGIRPYGSGKHATLKIVDRDAYLTRCQDVDRFRELFPIIHRGNPQEFVIGNRKPGIFQPPSARHGPRMADFARATDRWRQSSGP